MPRPKTFREDEALEKAMELFWEKGYGATSIQDLVDCLGINRSSLYDSFGGKQELFEKSLENYREGNKRKVIEFLETHSSVREGFINLFQSSLAKTDHGTERRGCLVVNTTAELMPGNKWVTKALDEHNAQFEKIFFDYLNQGVRNGEISPDKDLKSIATMLFTLYSGINVVGKIKPDRKKLLSAVETGLSVLD